MSAHSMLWIPLLLGALICSCAATRPDRDPRIVFAVYVGGEVELPRLRAMVESLRTYGGRCAAATVRVYVPGELEASATRATQDLPGDLQLTSLDAPEEAAWCFLAGKVFAAAAAEEVAEGNADILALLDADTVFFEEPAEFLLPAEASLGYRPTFHRNINPLLDEPVDDYWLRAYELIGVREASLFEMVTPAHGEAMRPYFQAGCVVVRPERGLFRAWTEAFAKLYRDPEIEVLCEEVPLRRIFTFQVALTGAILTRLERSEMVPFSDAINYPVFFEKMFGAEREFRDLTGAATIRFEHFFDDPPEGWERELLGPADRIAWLGAHFSENND